MMSKTAEYFGMFAEEIDCNIFINRKTTQRRSIYSTNLFQILNEMKLDSTGSIGLSEFKIIITRLPEFEHSFYFKL